MSSPKMITFKQLFILLFLLVCVPATSTILAQVLPELVLTTNEVTSPTTLVVGDDHFLLQFSLTPQSNVVLDSLNLLNTEGDARVLQYAQLTTKPEGNYAIHDIIKELYYENSGEFFETSLNFNSLNIPMVAGNTYTFAISCRALANSAGNTLNFTLAPEQITTTPASNVLGSTFSTGSMDVRRAGSVLSTIAAGSRNFYALTPQGNLLGFGASDRGQLGLIGPYEASPRQIQILDNSDPIVSISAGADHALALGQSGNVYGFGSNVFGQSGSMDGAPTLITMPHPMQQVVCGAYSSYALSLSGNVYAWGRNASGQLGVGDFLNRSTPTPVHLAEKCHKIAAGVDHVLFITVDISSSIFGAGSNGFGQLASSNTQAQQSTPVLLGTGVSDIFAGAFTSYMIYGPNKSSCGKNNASQLGFSPNGPITPSFTGGGESYARQMAAGYAHCVLLGHQGQITVTGSNGQGQIGAPGPYVEITEVDPKLTYGFFSPLDNKFAHEIAAGPYSTLVKKGDGNVVFWGIGPDGQTTKTSQLAFPRSLFYQD